MPLGEPTLGLGDPTLGLGDTISNNKQYKSMTSDGDKFLKGDKAGGGAGESEWGKGKGRFRQDSKRGSLGEGGI